MAAALALNIPVISFFIGDLDITIAPLFALCALNLASAIAYHFYARTASVRKALYEALKAAGVFVIVSTARQFDVALSVYNVTPEGAQDGFSLRNMAIVCFIAVFAINICNNWEKIGLPLPAKLKSAITSARDAVVHLSGRKK